MRITYTGRYLNNNGVVLADKVEEMFAIIKNLLDEFPDRPDIKIVCDAALPRAEIE